MREHAAEKFHPVFHESTHRSYHLKRRLDGHKLPKDWVTESYGISENGKTADQTKMIDLVTGILVEGTADWLTLEARGLIQKMI